MAISFSHIYFIHFNYGIYIYIYIGNCHLFFFFFFFFSSPYFVSVLQLFLLFNLLLLCCLTYCLPALKWFDLSAKTFVTESVMVPLYSIVPASDFDSAFITLASFR
jgi:hypothetical protein